MTCLYDKLVSQAPFRSAGYYLEAIGATVSGLQDYPNSLWSKVKADVASSNKHKVMVQRLLN